MNPKKNSSKAYDGIARANIEMRKSIDDNEQYGRRLCLRSGGVSIKDKENRTTVYRSKKYLRKGIKEHLGPTKSRHALLSEANG